MDRVGQVPPTYSALCLPLTNTEIEHSHCGCWTNWQQVGISGCASMLAMHWSRKSGWKPLNPLGVRGGCWWTKAGECHVHILGCSAGAAGQARAEFRREYSPARLVRDVCRT